MVRRLKAGEQMRRIPIMPESYRGEYGTSCGYTTTTPRKWTDKEIEWTKQLMKDGYTCKEIAISLDRTPTSVSIKTKRLKKKDNTYNQGHVKEKYALNEAFLNELKPKTVLDMYCGEKCFYKEYDVTTNDLNENIKADYHEDALRLICKLYSEHKKYDLIDLDPFGSAYDLYDLAIKMAKKGLAITLGELGHKRWKRLDYVKTHYDIQDMDSFTIENIISYIQKIGLRNKKKLEIWNYREWRNTGRVYFIISDYKITEQWKKE